LPTLSHRFAGTSFGRRFRKKATSMSMAIGGELMTTTERGSSRRMSDSGKKESPKGSARARDE